MGTMLTASEPYTGTIKVSVPYYEDTKEIEVNFDELNQKETIRIGHIYPNLETQASQSIEGIERIKGNMLNDVCRLLCSTGPDIIEAQIDAIVDCMTSELSYVQESLSDHQEWFNDLHHKIHKLTSALKLIIHLNMDRESLRRKMEHIEHAQNGMLL